MRRRWAVGLTLLALASGCTTAAQGTPTEDPAAVAARMFPLAAAARDQLLGHIDGRYTSYYYMRLGSLQRGTESDVSLLGDNPSVLEVRQSRLDPALKLTIYHSTGSTQDLLKLEGKFTVLEPTPWVSYPTNFSSNNTITCSYPAIITLCNVERARAATEEAKPPDLPHDVEVLTDGAVELHSGVSLKSLLDAKVFAFTAETSKRITPEMTRAIVPIKILLDPDKKLRSIEVNGEIPGKPDSFVIQIGFELHGPANNGDFPPMPKPEETTVIPDDAGREQLWERINSS